MFPFYQVIFKVQNKSLKFQFFFVISLLSSTQRNLFCKARSAVDEEEEVREEEVAKCVCFMSWQSPTQHGVILRLTFGTKKSFFLLCNHS